MSPEWSGGEGPPRDDDALTEWLRSLRVKAAPAARAEYARQIRDAARQRVDHVTAVAFTVAAGCTALLLTAVWVWR